MLLGKGLQIMQKKTKSRIFKSITAVILCTVLVLTSVPFALSAGAYDPIPTFPSDKADREVSAFTNENGGITVVYPQATANTSRKTKTVTGYMLELVDLGLATEPHTDTVLLRKTVTPSGTAPYESEFTQAEIATVLGDGLLETHRYNITVTAIDSEGWMSEELNAIVSDVPTYEYDYDTYSPLTADDHAMREMMTFEASASTDSGNAYGLGSSDYIKDAECLDYTGATEQTGAKDVTTGVDTKAQRFYFKTMPTSETNTFDITWSRQTWDFDGAEEVWYWFDFTQVSVQGLSFRLRANEKEIRGSDRATTWNNDQSKMTSQYGDTVYSTLGTTKAGYKGEAPYVYIARDDGGWDKVMLTNGTLDLSDFRGYIRVPLQFMCSETDTVIDAINTEIGTVTSDTLYAGLTQNSKTKQNVDNYVNGTLKLTQSVTVDPAGTAVNKALLIQTRSFRMNLAGINNFYDVPVGTMLAAGLGNEEAQAADNDKRATVDTSKVGTGEDPIVNRENGYKATNDLYAAGFSFTGCSDDSLNKSFFLDNVMFYRTDNQAYSENTLDGSVNTGDKVSKYYDQSIEIPKAIFEACNQYISDPDWGDYRAVEYIEDLIEGYKTVLKAYNNEHPTAPINITFLEESELATIAADVGMSDAWNNFLTARDECKAAETYNSENSDANDLVWRLTRDLEKIPEITDSVSVSDEVKNEIIRIYKIYSRLNLGQLRNLGDEEEQKLLDYFKFFKTVLEENTVAVGQKLTDNPFVPFNTFENLDEGTRAYQFENSLSAGTYGSDYLYTKGFLTWTGNFVTISGHSADTATPTLIPTGAMATDQQRNGMSTSDIKHYGGWVDVTENGAQGTKGATLTIDNRWQSSGYGLYNVISVSKDGKDAGTYEELRANNMGTDDIKLGSLAKGFSGDGVPLSLVFYADFSQLKDYSLAATISTWTENQAEDYTIDLGSSAANSYFYLLSPTTGEWVKATNEDNPRIYNYLSSFGADSDGDGTKDLFLDNYKGYIMIPLFHFKRGVQGVDPTSSWKLDETAQSLNSIFRISIAVAPTSEEAAKAMDGKTFTIDNIGFSYDRDFYSDVAATRGIEDKSFDEMFGTKALPSAEFEAAVAAIDPYEDDFATAISDASAIYAKLSAYQKTLDSVKDTYALLQKYEQWNADPTLKPQPVLDNGVSTVTETVAAITALPEAVTGTSKGSTVTGPATQYPGGQNDLPYPGFITDADGNVSVNYAAYSITKEQVDEIIAVYEQSYERFGKTKKALLDVKADESDALTYSEKLENAYLAAKRCKLLEQYLNEIQAFQTEISNMYTRYDVDGTTVPLISVDTDGMTKLKNAKTSYENLAYYAKLLMEDSSLPAVYTQFANSAKAVGKVLRNAQTYTGVLGANSTVDGGIVKLSKAYTDLFNDTKATLDSQKLFTEAQLNAFKDTVDEYNSFITAYGNIKELYDGMTVGATEDGETAYGIHDIYRLFARHNADYTDSTVYLSKDTLSATESYVLTYFEELPSADIQSTMIKLTSENGALTNAFSESENYSVKVTVNGTSTTYSAADLAAGIKITDVESNTYTPDAPLTISIEVSVASALTVSNAISDKLTFSYTDNAGNVIIDNDGNELEKTIEVIYTPEDAYTVTIPAEFSVPWGETADQSVDCKVSTSLKAGASLNVAVTCDGTPDAVTPYTGAGNLTSSNPAYNLNYSYKGFEPSTFTGVNTNSGLNTAPYLTISGWDDVPVGEYKTTLTYTVTYNSVTP